MKIALSTGWRFDSPPALKNTFQWAAEFQCDGLELIINNETLLRGKKFIKNLSERYKIPILNIHCPLISMPFFWPLKRGVKKTLNYASFFKASLVIIHPPYRQGYTASPGQKLVRYLAAEQTKYPQICITLENFEKDCQKTYRSLEHLKKLLERYHLSLTFDTTHVGASDYHLFAAYELVKKHIKNIHLSNYCAGAEHLPPFIGDLPLGKFLEKLKKDNYTGTLTLELLYQPFVSNKRVKEDIKRSVTFIKKILQ